jgi:hypothetical protein
MDGRSLRPTGPAAVRLAALLIGGLAALASCTSKPEGSGSALVAGAGGGGAGGRGGGGGGATGGGGGGSGGGGAGGGGQDAAAGSGGGDAWSAPDVFNPDPKLFLPSEGRRLKIRWTKAPDGQLSFSSFRDMHLGTDCGFMRAADGEWRCLPFGFFLGSAPIDYADTNCTEPAFVDSRASCNKHRYVRRQDTSTNPCETRFRIYKVGDPLPDDGVYWRQPAGPGSTELACKPAGILPTAGAFRVGEELPVSMFVRARRAPRGDGYPTELMMLEAEDGARVDSGWFLPSASAECGLYTLADKRLHCVPDSVGESGTYFADNACSQRPTVGHQPACGAAPKFVRKANPNACEVGATLMGLGTRLENLFWVTGGACASIVTPLGLQYHRLGDPVAQPAMDGMPAFDYVQEGSERVQRRKLVSPGGWRLGSNWYDSQRKESCTRGWFGDKHRCSPNPASLSFLYADINCTQPVYARAKTSCAPPKYASNFSDDGCPAREQVWAVGPEYTGDVFRRINSRYENRAELECQLFTKDASSIYHSTSRVPDTDLAEMDVVEPK